MKQTTIGRNKNMYAATIKAQKVDLGLTLPEEAGSPQSVLKGMCVGIFGDVLVKSIAIFWHIQMQQFGIV